MDAEQRQTGNNSTNIQLIFTQKKVFDERINYNQLKFKKFEILISAQRLSRYKASCANDTRRTTCLYRANIRISQAFLATLSIF
jgi:hypothetical protein